MVKYYQHILALVFAINEINKDPKILPNVTLGFHIYDSYSSASLTYRVTLDMLCKSQAFIPNYKCGLQNNVIGVTGGFDSETSSYMADILGIYKIPQVGFNLGGFCRFSKSQK
ncbi:vomeronasal type-2 receptor 26-like [Anolis carolinensis]|uniref:vomeronasal type-2 receptor 26-like n=1 Tax=Anolis carolinensis TaxID=28377 RepID=UPI002F2B6DED